MSIKTINEDEYNELINTLKLARETLLKESHFTDGLLICINKIENCLKRNDKLWALKQ